MGHITQDELYTGVSISFAFATIKPMFGDLFTICGFEHPNFPPRREVSFDALSKFGFEQVDDYFGISNAVKEVVIWLFPLVNGEDVYHCHGPFDGLRLTYSVLRNRSNTVPLFLTVVQTFINELGVVADTSLEKIESKIQTITEYWALRNVVVGSPDALAISY